MSRLQRSFALVTTLLLLLAASTAAATGARVASYDLNVDVDPAARSVHVRARVALEGAGDLTLYLAPFARDVAAGSAASGEVDVGLVTEPRTGERAWRLDLSVPRSVLEPEEVLDLTYVLEIPDAAEGIALHLGEREGYLLSESAWYPVEAEALLPRPTPYRLRVRVPGGLTAVGAGVLEREGSATILDHPAPGRPFFAYGPYERSTAGALELWLAPERTDDAAALLPLLEPAVTEIVARYESLFGSGCDAVRLVAVSRRGGWGAPCTLLLAEDTFGALAGADALDPGTYGFLAHELAHTWWGNRVVPAAPAYGLLVEGMAEYLSALAVEARYGSEAAAAMWRDWRLDAVGDDALADLTVWDDAYTTLAYAKGAWVHRMLADQLGEDAYLRVLGELARAAPQPDLTEFRERLERSSGFDLERFFEEWIRGSAYPRYELRGAAGAWALANSGEAATPPLTLELDGRRERVTVEPGASLELTAEAVGIDPAGSLLALPPRADAATEALAEAAMERLVAALGTGDPARVAALFAEPDAAVETIAGLAGELVVDGWTLQSAEGGARRSLTYQLEAHLGERSLAGPLVLAIDVDGELLAVESVRLNYR